MPKRLRLMHDDDEWLAEIDDSRVHIEAAGGGRQAAGGRLQAAGDERQSDHVVRELAPGSFEVDGPDGKLTGSGAGSGDVVWVGIAGEAFEFRVVEAGGSRRALTREHDALTPPMSATVVRIAVKPGDRVRQGDVLIALEAMKMELPIRAPRDGVVAAIHCREGELVEPGTELVEVT